MSMYSFNEFLDSLPDCDRFPVNDPPPLGIGYVDQGTQKFVPCYLSKVEDSSSSTNKQVLIVSAPRAVGKSTLAKETAFRKNALLWDLAEAPEVGAGSLAGTLFGTLALGAADDFMEFIREGIQFLIIDALDEGRAKVNENSFQRLLEEIGHLADDTRDTCFVLFGRTRIAETAWLALAEKDVSVSMLSIVPFDRRQANDYIDNKVGAAIRTEAFYECRDLVFEQLAFSVTQEPSSDTANEFLHYPPVLDVVSTLLR